MIAKFFKVLIICLTSHSLLVNADPGYPQTQEALLQTIVQESNIKQLTIQDVYNLIQETDVQKTDAKMGEELKDVFPEGTTLTTVLVPKLTYSNGKISFEVEGKKAVLTFGDSGEVILQMVGKTFLFKEGKSLKSFQLELENALNPKTTFLDFFLPLAHAGFFLGVGIVLAVVSFAYGILKKSIKKNKEKFESDIKKISTYCSDDSGEGILALSASDLKEYKSRLQEFELSVCVVGGSFFTTVFKGFDKSQCGLVAELRKCFQRAEASSVDNSSRGPTKSSPTYNHPYAAPTGVSGR